MPYCYIVTCSAATMLSAIAVLQFRQCFPLRFAHKRAHTGTVYSVQISMRYHQLRDRLHVVH
jgi:hypothetical protein